MVASGFWGRARGMLFRSAADLEGIVLCLAPCSAIHTMGMRVALDVAFLDCSGRVMKAQRSVKPGVLRFRQRGSCIVLERMDSPDTPWLAEGDCLNVDAIIRPGGTRQIA